MCLVKSPPRLPRKQPAEQQREEAFRKGEEGVAKEAVTVKKHGGHGKISEQQQHHQASGKHGPEFPAGLKILVVRGVEELEPNQKKKESVDWDAISKTLRSFGFLVDFAPDMSRPMEGHDLLLVGHGALSSPQRRCAMQKVGKAIPTLCFLARSTEDLVGKIKDAKLASAKEVVVCPCSPTKLALIWQHTVRRLMMEQDLTPGAIHGKSGEDFILGAKNYQAKRCTSPIIKNIKREKRLRRKTTQGSTNPLSKNAAVPSETEQASGEAALDSKEEKKVKRRRRRSWKTHTLESQKMKQKEKEKEKEKGGNKNTNAIQHPTNTNFPAGGARAMASSKTLHLACHLPDKESMLESSEVFGSSQYSESNPSSPSSFHEGGAFPCPWDKEYIHLQDSAVTEMLGPAPEMKKEDSFLDLLKVGFEGKTCSDDSSFFALPSPDVVSQLYL